MQAGETMLVSVARFGQRACYHAIWLYDLRMKGKDKADWIQKNHRIGITSEEIIWTVPSGATLPHKFVSLKSLPRPIFKHWFPHPYRQRLSDSNYLLHEEVYSKDHLPYIATYHNFKSSLGLWSQRETCSLLAEVNTVIVSSAQIVMDIVMAPY